MPTSAAYFKMFGTPARRCVVPHVFNTNLVGKTKSDDSDKT
jgi:hypothetical protein